MLPKELEKGWQSRDRLGACPTIAFRREKYTEVFKAKGG
jgi:hypothetical protein